MSDFLSQMVATSGVGGTSMPTIKENEVVTPEVVSKIPSTEELPTEDVSEDVSTEEVENTEESTEEEVIPKDKKDFDYEEKDEEDPFAEKPKIKEPPPKETLKETPKTRDYSGFTDAEIAHLKRTSNDSFAYLSTELRKAKAAQTRIQELETNQANNLGQFSDPDGYLKSEEYTTTSQEYQKSELYLNHWKEQLANVHDAKPWLDLEFDANGKIVTVEKQPTAAAISDLTDRLARTRNYQDSLRSKAETIQKDWSTKAQRLPAFVEAKTKEFFPEYATKTDDANYKQMDAVLQQMGQARNPVASLLKTMYTAHMDLIPKYLAMEAKLKTYEGQTKQRQVNAKLGKQVEPSPSTNRKTVKPTGSIEFDYNDHQKVQGEMY